MKYVRITIEPTADVQSLTPILIDAIIDDANNIVGVHPLFGVQGDPERRRSGERFEPFVLDVTGLLDWGDGFDPTNDRYGKLDLHNRPVAIGRILTLNYGARPEQYRIVQITTLL